MHALENLAMLDTGITTLRRPLCEQIKRVGDGLMRDPHTNQRIPAKTWSTILSPTETPVPYAEDL